MDPAAVAALYVEHAHELRCFLIGVLRDGELANEALQAAFAKAIEVGHTARDETRKAWLFRVALNEALALRRREAIGDKVTRKVAWTSRSANEETPFAEVMRFETVQQVRDALETLPADQRQVVQLRIYEEKTFATIAEELNIPLGTVLTRMRLALRKLKKCLDHRGEEHE